MPTEEQVVEVVKKVFDPEIPVNIYDLGLIYKIEIPDDDTINIEMSLTSQACPAAQSLPEDIRGRVVGDLGVEAVNVNVVWDPPWGPHLISPEGKKILNLED